MRRDHVFTLAAILAAAGCSGGPDPDRPAPKSLTISEVQQLPLEEAGDLSVRQNLAEQPKRPVLGKDSPVTIPPR
jgi:hypothetical protein